MKLWTINRILRRIGLVLTLYTGIDVDGDQYYAFTLERASKYDKRVADGKKATIKAAE